MGVNQTITEQEAKPPLLTFGHPLCRQHTDWAPRRHYPSGSCHTTPRHDYCVRGPSRDPNAPGPPWHYRNGHKLWPAQPSRENADPSASTDSGARYRPRLRQRNPVIYDPGSLFVAAAHQAGIPVMAIPGPSVLTAAAAISGFSGDAIIFEGHLPSINRRLTQYLSQLRHERKTLVFYVSPKH
jgi:Predicted methyltransferases